jgi:DNA-binding transcriptional ArsR family regulator
LTCRKALCHAADTLPKVCERTMESVPTPLEARHDALDRAAAFPRVMGNVDSLHLRAALPHEERCVGQLAQRLSIQQPTLSQQLTVLRHLDFVETRRVGKHVFYRLARRFGPQFTLVLALAQAA